MAGYESTQLIEPFHEEDVDQVVQRRPVRPWRRFGIGAGVVATLGAVAGFTLRPKPVTPLQRLHKMKRSLLQAFSARSLAEAADMKATLGFTFAEVDQEEFAGTSIDAKIETMEADVDTMTIEITFNSKEGKAADLVGALKDLMNGTATVMDDMMGPGQGAMVAQLVSIKEGDDDEAVITIVPPPEPEEAEEEFEESLETKPHFTASLKLGASIVEMFENQKEKAILAAKGITGHVDAAVYHKMVDAAVDMNVAPPDARPMSGLATMDVNYDFRYREDSSAWDDTPTLSGFVNMVTDHFFRDMPEDISAPLSELEEFADGLKSIEITGLPDKYGIVVNFKNFHITPILKDIIEALKAEEDSEEDP